MAVKRRAYRLYDKLTMGELVNLQTEIMRTRARKVKNSIHLYDKQTARLLDDISWAITWKMKDEIELLGEQGRAR